MRPQPLEDGLTRLHADKTIDLAAGVQDQQRRYSLDTETCRSSLVCIDVEFTHQHLARKLVGKGLYRRGDHPARTAPGCPQIEKNRQR